MREIDMHAEAVRRVADDLAAVRVAAERLTRYARECTLTAAHFGGPDLGHQLAAAFTAQRHDAAGALGHGAQLVATLADDLRASAQTVAAADQRSAEDLRAAGD
jgi:hypothetical protein